MPKTTDAVVVVSSCGTVIKRLPYLKWNKKKLKLQQHERAHIQAGHKQREAKDLMMKKK